ncbi:hypothetical protein M404DRAFT_21367 [Pisolithus tinctorius Marx 270]|uniref:Uncharacterized protein n=1 Tax=Pisolithus tinctorius Marx 270 TaxID=870435 RepID=A0A0C3PA28_PISTI|nr:hypothetical protein M404DRAFT_21367 [Pisolithus tinctorius Marx 270]
MQSLLLRNDGTHEGCPTRRTSWVGLVLASSSDVIGISSSIYVIGDYESSEDILELEELPDVLEVSSELEVELSLLELLGPELGSSLEELISESSLELRSELLSSNDSHRREDLCFLFVLLVRLSSFSSRLNANPM